MTNELIKAIESGSKSSRFNASLIEFISSPLKFESELQKKEYEQTLRDVHCSSDRRTLIHSKKGGQIVLLYMKVRQIGVQQAMRELITDEAYTLFVCQ